MNLYLVGDNEFSGWDTYSGFIVAAFDAEDALLVTKNKESAFAGWGNPPVEEVKFIGTATIGIDRGIILECFHAG